MLSLDPGKLEDVELKARSFQVTNVRILNLLSLLASHPGEVYGRLEGIVDSRLEPFRIPLPSYPISDTDRIDKALLNTLGVQLAPFLREPALRRIEEEVSQRINALPQNGPFSQSLNGDFHLARLCYALCRALRPANVIETGVCYGVTTAFLLQSLRESGGGILHSIDLPPLGKEADDFVGILVPEALRSRWKLQRGTSKSRLPELLRQIGEVDFFVHDSLHTYRNMQRELTMVTPFLSRPALVVSDDVEGNPAFAEWVGSVRPRYWAVLKQEAKPSLLGIALFDDRKPS